MPYIRDGRMLIQRAFKGRYAMPAFNICSLEMAQACIEAAEELKAPIIIQTAPGDLGQLTHETAAGMVVALAEQASVPVMLHRDHGEDLDEVARALRAGYASVMFDGEEFPLDENIARTRNLARFAHAARASLEAAAGSFGGGEEGASSEVHLTEPEAAARLLREGEADMVACSVGSVHGQASRLDLDRLEAIATAARGPIVLHGGTGIADADVAAATELGVVKINIGAGLARAVGAAWKSGAADDEPHFRLAERIRENCREVAGNKITVMKAAGKAA